jgi:hypothetical protein
MIARASLLRTCDSPFGTFGLLDLFDVAGQRVARFMTAEDDNLKNLPSVSCIAVGIYRCRRLLSPKHGETFEVEGVPGRSHILFHEGNTEEDTEGCILLGTGFGGLVVRDEDDPNHPRVSKWAVTASVTARAQFMALLAGVEEFQLEVRWAIGDWR